MDMQSFISALRFVSHASAVRDVRHYLKGVLFEFSADKLVLVGCDGARLAAVTLPPVADVQGSFIVSNASVKQIVSMFGKDKTGNALFKNDGKQLALSSIFGASYNLEVADGTYPDWRRVVPAGSREITTMPQISPLLLGDACKAIAPLCRLIKGVPSIRILAAGEGNSVLMRPQSIANPQLTDVLVVVQPTRV